MGIKKKTSTKNKTWESVGLPPREREQRKSKLYRPWTISDNVYEKRVVQVRGFYQLIAILYSP